MLQYRTTFINGTAILGDITRSTATLDQKLRLIDIAYIEAEENETSLKFLDGSKTDIWPWPGRFPATCYMDRLDLIVFEC